MSAVVRWHVAEIDLTGTTLETELVERLRTALSAATTDAEGRPVAVRLRLGGSTLLFDMIESRPKRLLQTVLEIAGEIAGDDIWIEKIQNETSPVVAAAPGASSEAATELVSILDEIAANSQSIADQFRVELDALRAKLPEDLKDLDAFQEAFSVIDGEKTSHTADMARLQDDLQKLEERIAKLSLGGAVATKEELDASREARGEAWKVVRGMYIDKENGFEDRARALAPDGHIAAVFERRMTEADIAADAIIAHTKEAAELSISARQKTEIGNKFVAAAAKTATIQARHDALAIEWTALWPIETVIVQRPVEMTEWLRRREALLRENAEHKAESDAIAELEVKEERTREDLMTALKSFITVDDASTLNTLRNQARTLINEATGATMEHEKARESLETQRQRKRQADTALGRIKTQISEWSMKWTAALTGAGLKDDLSTEAATAILEIMTTLDGLKLQIDALSHRIRTMTEDKASFQVAIKALGPLVANMESTAAGEISRQLEIRLDLAKAADGELRRLRDQRKIRTDAQTQGTERMRHSHAELEALCTAAGCDDSSKLAEIEQSSASKQESLRERERLETRLLEDGAGLSLEALFAECDGVAGDELPGTISSLNTERTELDATTEKHMTERAALRAGFEALFGQNQAADTFQEAANVEAEIANLTRAYVDLTLQEIVLRQAIDLYRDRNQGPILSRARALFAKLTDGAYSGLRADVDDHDEPILIAEHATRGSLEVKALSDGTVDPLYLALRLAVVQEHNATNEPLPFIADDLLLSLDNTRSQATLRTLGMLAKTDQVLFFTHHEHMIELARRNVPKDILMEHKL